MARRAREKHARGVLAEGQYRLEDKEQGRDDGRERGVRRISGRSVTKESPHDESEIERRDVREISLADVVASSQSHSAMGTGLARKGKGAFDSFTPQPLQFLALGAADARAILMKGFPREHPALVRESVLAPLVVRSSHAAAR